ncbi:MAG TPA: capsule assembly Wzi family protein [bacterium]|nr:capsule assembly Wzi family protein [bacterium]HPN42149.1 capsule assembly Wzi family protein [bacterium]
MKSGIISYFFILGLCISPALAETLPPYHPAYVYIDELQARGYCLDLPVMNRPYTREQIKRSLLALQAKSSSESLVAIDNFLSPLLKEFAREITVAKGLGEESDAIFARSFVQGNLDMDKDETRYKGIYRAGVGTTIMSNLTLYSGVNFNQYDVNNEDYQGYEWRGVTGYMEQAYTAYQTRRYTVKFGRDFMIWGPAQNGSLVMSGIARPLDHLYAALNFGPFRFSWFAAELDDHSRKKTNSAIITVKRYLAGHRLDARFWRNRLQIGISELMLYGGDAEKFNIVYLNPVMFYHGEHKNNASHLGNVLPTMDILIYPRPNWNIYTSLLIDDYQVEKVVVTDLEPNEIGFIIGTTFADPFNIQGSAINLEYTRITNRTYKTEDALETFIHRGVTLGHPLGNDFDRILVGLAHWVRSDLQVKANYSHIRHGEGSIYTPWDMPWMNFTLEEGYSEPFPFGTVESRDIFEIQARWYYNDWLRFNLQFQSYNFSNQGNIEGQSDSYLQGKINIELNPGYLWKINNPD